MDCLAGRGQSAGGMTCKYSNFGVRLIEKKGYIIMLRNGFVVGRGCTFVVVGPVAGIATVMHFERHN